VGNAYYRAKDRVLELEQEVLRSVSYGRVAGFRSQRSGFRSQRSRFRSQGSGFRSQGSGFRV